MATEQSSRRRTTIRRPTGRNGSTRRAVRALLPMGVHVESIVVAIPARNERALIERALASIDAAVVRTSRRAVIAVAADTCLDDTAAVVRVARSSLATPVVVVEGRWRAAGGARAAAVAAALEVFRPADLSTIWIANTDADCVVPSTWLQIHLDHAAAGAHAVAGVVDLDPATTDPELLAQFRATYGVHGMSHTHVHGANFGVRADAYERVGGWNSHAVVGEDHELLRSLVAAELAVHHVTDSSVVTSSRTAGRVPAGFAGRLARLVTPQRGRQRSRFLRTMAAS